MVGAGIVALVQVALIILRRGGGDGGAMRTPTDVRRSLGIGIVGYLIIAVVIALLGGLVAELSILMLVLFLIYAAFAALMHELIVGLAAMHSGWLAAFAVALITLVIGILLGFPPVALALLVFRRHRAGFCRHRLRPEGRLHAARLWCRSGIRTGRTPPAIACGDVRVSGRGGVVVLSHRSFFARDMVAPRSHVYVATIRAGASASVAWQLLVWAIPGAIIQFLAGRDGRWGCCWRRVS